MPPTPKPKSRFISLLRVEALRPSRMHGNPYVFVRLSTLDRLKAPRKEFEAGRAAAKTTWPGFHSFRHYRATQWLKHGVDIRTAKEWLEKLGVEARKMG